MRLILRYALAVALTICFADVAPAAQITLNAIQNGNVTYDFNPSNGDIVSPSYTDVTSSTINASTTFISSSSQIYSDADFLFNLSSVLPTGATITGASLTLSAPAGTTEPFYAYGFSDSTGNLMNDSSEAAYNASNNGITSPFDISAGANTCDVTSYFTATPGPNTLDYVGLGLTAFYYGPTYSGTLDSLAATSGVPTLTLTYTPAAVPEPASVVMLGAALAAAGLLAGLRRGGLLPVFGRRGQIR
jgi:hypothetical protein